MNVSRILAGGVAVGLMTGGAAMAQDRPIGEYGPIAGDWELLLQATGSNDRRFDAGGFGLAGEVGYYVTDEILVNLRQSWSYADSRGTGSSSALGTGLGVDYHFDLGQFRPFIGATISFLYGNAIQNTWAAGPEAGVKWYLDENTFLIGRVNYEFFFRSGRGAEDNWDDGRFAYLVGIGLNF